MAGSPPLHRKRIARAGHFAGVGRSRSESAFLEAALPSYLTSGKMFFEVSLGRKAPAGMGSEDDHSRGRPTPPLRELLAGRACSSGG